MLAGQRFFTKAVVMTESPIAPPAPSSAAGPRSVHVTDVVDVCAFRGLPFIVSIFTVLALAFDGFDIQAVGFVAPALLGEWGISRAGLGPVLAAGLVGMALGSILMGPVGDRRGRRMALIASMTVIAIGSLLSAVADSPQQLTIYRFITGVGLGGSLPNATALMVELAPLAVRNLVVSITVVGVPIGGVIGAAVAAQLLPALGWRSVFVAGAILPTVLAIAMWLWMPESPRFLARRPGRSGELARMLNRLGRTDRFTATDRFVITEPVAHGQREGLRALLSPLYRTDTLLLWLAFFASIFCVYALFNWLPTVLSGVGLPVTVALRGALVFNLGGVIGALIMATAMNRFGSRYVLVTFSLIATGLMLTLASLSNSFYSTDNLAPLLLLMAAAGTTILGMQVGLYSLAAHAYPTANRASGVGAALGVGRVGGILSAFAGGIPTSIGQGVTPFFAAISVVVLLMAIAVAVFRRHIPPVQSTLNPGERRAMGDA
jgi:AAHS family 4-hydroxybenzoate transporter-like MFS transporter